MLIVVYTLSLGVTVDKQTNKIENLHDYVPGRMTDKAKNLLLINQMFLFLHSIYALNVLKKKKLLRLVTEYA